jgi:hypothetical protein
MKRSGLIFLAGLVLALAAYLGGNFIGTAKTRALLRSDTPELAWLKEEFNLSDAEFKRISDLHGTYLPLCKERCRQIDEINDQLKILLSKASTVTPEIEAKLAESAALRLKCQEAMLSHFLAVSKAMPPEQGKRYLAWIEQRTFMSEHRMSEHQHEH